MNGYQNTIREQLAKTGHIGTDPRHVEAWMRVEHSTLDWMDRRRFNAEITIAVECIQAAGVAESETLARSLGC